MNELNLIQEGADVPVYDDALHFDSTYNDAVNIGTNFVTGARTVSFWLKPNITTFNGMTRQFHCVQYGSSNQRTFLCEFFSNGLLRCYFSTTTSGNSYGDIYSDAGQYFNAGQWYHVCFTIESAGLTKMYIDGVQQVQTHPNTLQLSRTGAALYWGGFGPYISTQWSDSTMKELAIWTVERTPIEVVQDMTRTWTGSESGLKAYFPTDEGSGNTVQDINSVYSGSIITLNTTPNYINDFMWVREQKVILKPYQRINFNAQGISNDELSIGTIVNGFRTISFFFTPNININPSTPSMVIGTQDGATYNVGQMFFWFQNGKLYFLTRYSSGSVQITSDISSFSPSTEYHVSIVIDPSSGVRMILDGVTQSTTNPQTASKPINSQPFIFGRNRVTWTRPEIKIRNVQIWSNALTNIEIDNYKSQYLPAGTSNLMETYHFKDEQGTTVTGENGNNGTISTSNAGGLNYIDTVIRQVFYAADGNVFINGSTEKVQIDLFENQFVSVTKQSFDINNLGKRLSGVTNNFNLPLTAKNSETFDYLDLNGNLSNKPYQINYVEYIQDGTPIIKKGRLNVKEISESGYKVDVTHGINDFFDRIRNKQLYEPFVSRQFALDEMYSLTQIASNDLTIQNNEGIVIPLVDYGFIDPIPYYQQSPFAIAKKAFDFIAEDVGYTFVDGTNGRLDDLLFSPIKPFDASAEMKEISGNFTLNGGQRILLSTFYTTKKGNIEISLNFIKTDIVGSNTVSFDFVADGVVFDSYSTSSNVEDDDTSPFSPTLYEIGTKLEVFMYSNDPVSHSMNVNIGKITYPTGTQFGVISSLKIYYENTFKISQIEFIKHFIELFNLSIEVDSFNKTFELYSLNDVYNPKTGNTIDFSSYYSNVISKKFESSFGNINRFKYEYENGIQKSYDSSIIANNTNKEIDLISSSLKACFFNSPLNVVTAFPYLMTSPCYDSNSQFESPSETGNRIVKQSRIPNATVYYTTGAIPYNEVGDQTVTSFDGLDWTSLIEDNYSSLRDNVLNRYAEVKVLMRVPRHLIDLFSFQNKIFIEQLNSKFVVQSIKTRPDGLSEWVLIKLN